MATDESRKSAVTTRRFAIAPLTKDDDKELTYGDVHEIPNDLISVKNTPRVNMGSQYASGIEVDSYAAKAGGTLDISVCGITPEDEKLLFGSSVDAESGVITSNEDDVIPDVCVMYSLERSDGKLNLYKYPKVKFTNQGESGQTKDENGITYQTQSLQGNYRPTINNGDDMYVLKGVEKDSEQETNWFASADGGIKAVALAEQSAVKVGEIPESISSDPTVVANKQSAVKVTETAKATEKK